MYDDDYYYKKDEAQEEEPKLDTEMEKQIKETLAKVLGLEVGVADRHLKNFTSNVYESFKRTLQDYVTKLIKKYWQEQLENETKKHIQNVFQKALKDTIITEKNQRYMQKQCQQIVLNEVKEFFASSWDSERERNKVIGKSLDDIIANTVDENVKEAIKEIKKETIDKFQKDVMKKMMMGMAREIGSDKKLLALMTE